MSYHKRPSSFNAHVRRRGAPVWLVFLLGMALVFGGYYLWLGARDFLQTGGLGIREATQRAAIIGTATQAQVAERAALVATRQATLRPTPTDVPECQMFRVTVNMAIIRNRPTTAGSILDQVPNGTDICVIAEEADGEWYLIDLNPRTRRLEPGYLRRDLVRPLNPTATPTRTFTPLPTVTPEPATATPTPTASETEPAPPP